MIADWSNWLAAPNQNTRYKITFPNRADVIILPYNLQIPDNTVFTLWIKTKIKLGQWFGHYFKEPNITKTCLHRTTTTLNPITPQHSLFEPNYPQHSLFVTWTERQKLKRDEKNVRNHEPSQGPTVILGVPWSSMWLLPCLLHVLWICPRVLRRGRNINDIKNTYIFVIPYILNQHILSVIVGFFNLFGRPMHLRTPYISSRCKDLQEILPCR